MNRICLVLVLAACGPARDTDTDEPAEPLRVRFATFNASMFRSEEGELAADLAGDDEQARLAATILQELRPDVVLLNEFDHDADGVALARFKDAYLAVGQDGREPLDLPYGWAPPVNTGVASGADLDNDGAVTTKPGSKAYGGDSFGFGEYPGQYGLVVLSAYPIVAADVRTFQELLWADVPGARLPDDPETATPGDWYSPDALAVFRLSSKTHADVPIDVGGRLVHFLVSHPTPPTFDGAEDRNGLRNHDEIRFWVDYLAGGDASWHVDDDGRAGALDEEPFVLAGDLNNDPEDGDGDGSVVADLLAHPRVARFAPSSAGAVEAAEAQGGRNDDHVGDPALDTADFNDNGPGNLRIDFVLPSVELPVLDGGVFWPTSDDPLFPLVGTFPFPVSDHRPVWVDVEVTR